MRRVQLPQPALAGLIHLCPCTSMGSATKAIGDVSEAAVTLALLKTGHVVLRPVGDNQRYDLVIQREGQFLRVQCKTGRIRSGYVAFRTCSVHGHRGKPSKSYEGEADLFGIYCPELDTTYLVPVSAVGKTSCWLRVDPYKTTCSKGLQAADYVIGGVTLECAPPKRISRKCERCQGPFEVRRGSNKQRFCSRQCAGSRSQIDWPAAEELRDLVWKIPAVEIAMQLGVTSTAVKKHCMNQGIQTPGRGYWARARPRPPRVGDATFNGAMVSSTLPGATRLRLTPLGTASLV